jgi:hypothetical protein
MKIGEPHEQVLESLSSTHRRAHRLRKVSKIPLNAWFTVRLTRESDAARVWVWNREAGSLRKSRLDFEHQPLALQPANHTPQFPASSTKRHILQQRSDQVCQPPIIAKMPLLAEISLYSHCSFGSSHHNPTHRQTLNKHPHQLTRTSARQYNLYPILLDQRKRPHPNQQTLGTGYETEHQPRSAS